MNNLFDKIKRKGMIEPIYLVMSIIIQRFFSYFTIFLLRLRGYRVSYSVLLGKHVRFFQGYKYAISLGENVSIGDGVHLKAGFNGKILVGDNVYIHDYSFLFAHERMEIGEGTMISAGCFIVDFNHTYFVPYSRQSLMNEKNYVSKKITIGKHVWIGASVVILPGVAIGDYAVIGAGSVVTKSAPSYAVVVGNPARVIKHHKTL